MPWGARRFLALNLAAFPAEMPEDMIVGILRGSAEKAREAGSIIAGGHTIDDDEPKFGLAVLGWVDPSRVGTKAKAQPGDRLILTKPLGTGIITTAYKADECAPDHIAIASDWMARLNKDAAKALDAVAPHMVTDVTGFGLLGHGWEVASKSGVSLRLNYDDLPFHPGATLYADDLLFPAMANNNQSDYQAHVTFDARLEYEQQLLAFCPETSGGLLISLAPDDAEAYLSRYRAAGHEAWEIGEVLAVEPDGEPRIEVI